MYLGFPGACSLKMYLRPDGYFPEMTFPLNVHFPAPSLLSSAQNFPVPAFPSSDSWTELSFLSFDSYFVMYFPGRSHLQDAYFLLNARFLPDAQSRVPYCLPDDLQSVQHFPPNGLPVPVLQGDCLLYLAPDEPLPMVFVL